ncbi:MULTISPECIES: AbrB/MazE/SpoVT family DNA-binding domain-containing protein [unclassified Endozoicomonas]|uniref:AbrB/MazE/SpoVT family DNA-binding domain-containing protein n=1 Tax=unclassified Endozoicomonas TaxID=2644528 RepID=UPI00214986AA|nr:MULTISPECIES: AbrB/MazE/SpoVT family DNA-binding domain-containing protein [unclassified Endozoicomonas]
MRIVRTSQHQVTIPADIRAKLSINQETEVSVNLSDDGEIFLIPARSQKVDIRNLHNKYSMDMSGEEFNQLIGDSRSDT